MFVAKQTRELFGMNNSQDVNPPDQNRDLFYTESDGTVWLADFVELPNMEEVLREIVPDVLVLGTTRSRSIQIVDQITNRTLGSNPCILLDGLPVFDQEVVFSLAPQEVIRIDVVKSKFILGEWVMDGILDIQTTNGSTPPEQITSASFCNLL